METKSITFPPALLRHVDAQARRERRNRSQLVRIAVEDYLEEHAPEEEEPRVRPFRAPA